MRLLHAGAGRLRHGAPRRRPEPTREEIRAALAGNLCRCGAYPKIERAILRASGHRSLRPRFVRTQREMEGRFEDVWALVDEDDDLETWPEGPSSRSSARRRPARTAPSARAAPRATRSTSRSRGCSSPRRAGTGRALPRDGPRRRGGPCRPGRPGRARAGRAVHDEAASGAHGRAALGRRADRGRRGRHAGGRSPRGRGARARARGARRRSTSTPGSTSSASPRSRGRPCAAIRTPRSRPPRCSSS